MTVAVLRCPDDEAFEPRELEAMNGGVGVSSEEFSLSVHGGDLKMSEEGSEGGEEKNDAVEVPIVDDESGESVKLGKHDEEGVDV